eukprot:scaffold26052_cov108-Cylindrotheca_fusiformis.AAC.2
MQRCSVCMCRIGPAELSFDKFVVLFTPSKQGNCLWFAQGTMVRFRAADGVAHCLDMVCQAVLCSLCIGGNGHWRGSGSKIGFEGRHLDVHLLEPQEPWVGCLVPDPGIFSHSDWCQCGGSQAWDDTCCTTPWRIGGDRWDGGEAGVDRARWCRCSRVDVGRVRLDQVLHRERPIPFGTVGANEI